MEPTPDLGISLGCSNEFIQTRLNNDSGAGVNASSRLDITLVPSDSLSELVWSPLKGPVSELVWSPLKGPVSELVWSPHKGLSLKCADGSFADKKSSLLWDVGPSNMVLSPRDINTSRESNDDRHNITYKESNDEKQINEINLITSQAAIHVKSEVGERENFTRPARGSDDINPVTGSSHIHHTDQQNSTTAHFLPLRTTDPASGIEGRETMGGYFNKVMMTDPDGRSEDDASGEQKLGLEVALASEIHTMKQPEMLDNTVQNLTSAGSRSKELALIIEKESENEMETRDSIESSPLEKLDSTGESNLPLPISQDASGQSEERVQRENSDPLEASPLNSRIHMYRRKGKEKASSDGDANQRMSKEKDDSDESIESCNSVRLFSTAKRPWSFEQQIFVGSKRVKKQVQESPASTSFVRQDSSFMNWISNMVKGLTKSDEAPSHALTLGNPPRGHEILNREIIACNQNTDPGSRNMGFQSLFQSLYCPNKKALESTCLGQNNEFRKQFLQRRNGDGTATQPRIMSATIPSTQQTCKANSAENRTSCDLPYFKAKDGLSPSGSSSSKCKTNSTDPPSKGKAIHSIGYRNDALKSLWITRFSSKPLGSVLDLDQYDQRTRRALECSADCTRPTTHAQSCVDFSLDHKGSEANEYSIEDPADIVGKELQEYAPNTGPSFKRIHAFKNQPPKYKLNPILPSPKYNSSEVMASVFARRLDAVNHIIPSDVKDNAINTTSTCFYCGRIGHDLRDCSEITQIELEHLLRNITPYDGAEESSSFCIRCFQLDHWAVSCPMVSSSRQNQPEYGASLVNPYTASKVQHPEIAGAQVIWFAGEPRVDTDFSLNPKCNIKITSENRRSSMKHFASSSGVNKLNEQISDVRKGMFDAIRRLRLSRMDIIKLMNSQVSLSQMDGFFIRLRLGQWEEGLGGTGYYVAYITGVQREKSSHNSKYSIPINVGGINCVVGSQYVSNHDFREDELMAWWCTTSRSGGKIPTEDELILKFEERKRLGI